MLDNRFVDFWTSDARSSYGYTGAELSRQFAVSQRHCEEHGQKKSALRGMLHTPIYLAMTIATQIDACKRSFSQFIGFPGGAWEERLCRGLERTLYIFCCNALQV